MKKTVGARIIAGLEEAIAYERGELTGVRITRVPLTDRAAKVTPAPAYSGVRVAQLRARLKLSQPVFVDKLDVLSGWTLTPNWEFGGAARI